MNITVYYVTKFVPKGGRTICQRNYSAKGLAVSAKSRIFAAMNTQPTDKQIAFPHAKINLGLFVTRR